MIVTKLIEDNPVIIHHKLSGTLTKSEALIGSEEAIDLVKGVIKNETQILLMIDVREYIFKDLEAHKVWAINFKENSLLQGSVKVALVGNNEPKFRAEKEYMESKTLQFFTKTETALIWLKNA
ncbi:hypothetical protein Q4567_22140 [Aliiglaciecola sp. 2_MG-2023]|uniref:hypothetical protein n=1 Tax=unclassified Aliiglaciecola TaxID=2593648 RepID=UPI0026E2B0EE|nr:MULTISPECIES: hypothetical protein [unclassified Aliiglaciecola]MDO6713440.1 hypothetical protein [Aliiglaciecola sp. 2_MG-2023]MDO6754582.1 hypothetical protein [Aliiglaciecola sp. 1_MG-2023]